ncbi:MAG: exosortase/archaeosortase family protein [Verrucomicrobia subdivision 3 bacterium]|nr:exosortase/archaeosortase family protein [Limisphaerales bacterium]
MVVLRQWRLLWKACRITNFTSTCKHFFHLIHRFNGLTNHDSTIHRLTDPLKHLLPFIPLLWFWVVLINHLRVEWTVNPQYAYGWAVPFLCAYLIWERLRHRPTETAPLQPFNPSTLQPSTASPIQRFNDLTVQRSNASPIQRFNESRFNDSPQPTHRNTALLVFLALLYAPTRLVEEANPEWRLVSWTLALEVVGLTLLWVRFVFNPQLSAAIAFPVCFFLVAVPWPTFIEHRAVQGLTQANVGTTVELLGWFGLPAIQHGNVIEISRGVLGIDEACSGIRSFQASLMISLFLGELFRLSVPGRAGLCLLGFVLSFVFNVIRTSVLVSVASARGIDAVSKWHDPAGVAIILACFITLWGISILIARRAGNAPSALPTPQPTARDFSTHHGPPLGAQRLALVLLGWLALVEVGIEAWYRRTELRLPPGIAWNVKVPREALDFRTLPIAEKARQILRYDEGLNASWRDHRGLRWQAIFLRWLPGRTAVHLARNHTPEICLTAVGGKLEESSELKQFAAHGLQLPFRTYTFTDNGRPVHVFYCLWDDRATIQQFDSMNLTYANRLRPVLAGHRHRGQRSLELVIWGSPNLAEAEAAVRGQLDNLISLEH